MHKLFSKEKCVLSKVKVCTTFLKNLKGLMFSRELKSDEALLLDCKQESVLNSSIHMFFVFQTIDAVWLNNDFEIVDIKKNLKPFTFLHIPNRKARYVLEMKNAKELKLGEKLTLALA